MKPNLFDIMCPNEDHDLILQGDPRYPSNYKALAVEFIYCIEEFPESECASLEESVVEIQRLQAFHLLANFVQADMKDNEQPLQKF